MKKEKSLKRFIVTTSQDYNKNSEYKKALDSYCKKNNVTVITEQTKKK